MTVQWPSHTQQSCLHTFCLCSNNIIAWLQVCIILNSCSIPALRFGKCALCDWLMFCVLMSTSLFYICSMQRSDIVQHSVHKKSGQKLFNCHKKQTCWLLWTFKGHLFSLISGCKLSKVKGILFFFPPGTYKIYDWVLHILNISVIWKIEHV